MSVHGVLVWVCVNGHVSSVVRTANADGVRRCFFCPAVAEPHSAELTKATS
jgi:hypothetical protein